MSAVTFMNSRAICPRPVPATSEHRDRWSSSAGAEAKMSKSLGCLYIWDYTIQFYSNYTWLEYANVRIPRNQSVSSLGLDERLYYQWFILDDVHPRNWKSCSKPTRIQPKKLTCPLKRDHFKGIFIFQAPFFREELLVSGRCVGKPFKF